MPKMSNVELLNQNQQPAIVIRTKTSLEKLPPLIGASFGALSAYLQEQGQTIADVPYVAYHNMDMQNLDVEIGFPVADPLPGNGEITSGVIPAGLRIFCMYRGPYYGIGEVYQAMQEWMGKHGYLPAGPSYEQYYNGLDFPESELLTKVVMLVRKADA